VYAGSFFKGKRHGFGETRFKDGRVQRGRYENGKFIG